MKLKKLAATLLAATLVLSCAACGSDAGAGSSNNGGSNSNSGKSSSSNSVDLKSQKVTLEMWCIATESDSNRKSYENAIEEMKKEYPDITLNWEAFENQSYKTKIKAAMAADEVPDIFFTWSCAFLGDFVESGKVYCLDDAYQEYKSELPEVMLGNSTYNGKHYGVPLIMNIVGLFCNMDLLKQVGYNEVPTSYDDLIKCCDALKAAGIIPFGCAGGETWCVTEYLEPVIEKSIGADALNDIFLGRASWNNADVANAVDTFQSMVQNGYFDPNAVSLTNDEVKANFMDGKYAFYQNGTWNCADFAANADFFAKVKVTEFPVIDSSKASLGQLIGGPSDTLAVAASSKNAAVAAKYTFELGKRICHYGYLDGCGLPAWNPYGDVSGINGLTQAVSEICAKANGYVLFGDTAQSADDANTYLDYVAQVYGCKINGNDFINGLSKDIR
ncbi:MAG: extracellular solute-binding protein [Lachnospiraceae bacterium]|nr:extracellular solute-binding protein [Lachnospiraceae bacterium]